MKRFFDNFLFLSPSLVIENLHLTRRNVRNIKLSLAQKMGAACLLVAILHLILNIALFIVLGIDSNWDTIGTYGLPSFLSQIIALAVGVLVILFETLSLKSQNKDLKNRLTILAASTLFISIAAQLFLTFTADAQMGYLHSSPTLSASITLISLLVIIQPVFWSEAIIFDGTISTLLIVFSIYFSVKYNIQGILYYIMIALAYPIACYLIISILFYAESLRYCEVLRNESLNNKAMYDELTHCKNRYSLNNYLEESKKRWSSKETNLLMIMFDIDNFKLYNDQYSHIGGDYCLKSICDAIRKEFPTPDLDFYRFGGEEFLLFFEAETKEDAAKIMKNVRECISNLGINSAKGAPKDVVTISVGGVYLKATATFNYEENLALVDKFLYEAKTNGKDVCVLNGDFI